MPIFGQHVVTDITIGKVTALCSYGYNQEEIAAYLNICVDTLVKYYADIIRTASIDANALVARKLFKKATEGGADGEGDLKAQELWLRHRERKKWSDPIDTNNQQNQSIQQVDQDVKKLEKDCPAI